MFTLQNFFSVITLLYADAKDELLFDKLLFSIETEDKLLFNIL